MLTKRKKHETSEGDRNMNAIVMKLLVEEMPNIVIRIVKSPEN
jgi:hypothetical protein